MQQTTTTTPRTIGMDLGIRKSNYCVLAEDGSRIKEGAIKTRFADVEEFLTSQPPSRLVIEACGPCNWIAEVARSAGHEVIAGNPRRFRLISANERKTDRKDAILLAEYGQFRPHLLCPIVLKGLECQIARAMLKARDKLVGDRTGTINFIRAQVRNLGEELPRTSAERFHRVMRDKVPAILRDTVDPMFDTLASIAEAIKGYNVKLEELTNKKFPEANILRQVPGIGPITALAYVVTIEDPSRFTDSRNVGDYCGLVPRSRASGDRNPELRISKCGDHLLRRLLVGAASYILRTTSPDSDLKRWGELLRNRGGQTSRGKARIAVARKLAVLLHRLWIAGEVYDPLRSANRAAA